METITKSNVIEHLIATIFSKSHRSGKPLFQKVRKAQVILYVWRNGYAYQAPYRCIPTTLQDLETITMCIKRNFPAFQERKEYYLFCTMAPSLPNQLPIEIRLLNALDQEQVIELKQQCDAKEVVLAELNAYDFHALGAFLNGKLVGISSLVEICGIYDVAVLVHPFYRQKGIASLLVANNSEWAIQQRGICMYRCDDFNQASYALAQKLGFEKKMDIFYYEWEG